MEKIDHIVRVAHALFNSPNLLPFINAGKSPEAVREGGFLCILQDVRYACGDEPAMRLIPLGTIPSEKETTYTRNAIEKAERIQANPELKSSWMNRDPSKSKYGGGIRAGEFILSFYGLPELADEAFVLAVAFKVRLDSNDRLHEIASISGSTKIFQHFMVQEIPASLL